MSRCIFWPERKSSPWPYPPPWRGRCRGPGRPRPRSPGRWRCSTCWSCCWSSPAASATYSGCSHTATGTKGFEVRTVIKKIYKFTLKNIWLLKKYYTQIHIPWVKAARLLAAWCGCTACAGWRGRGWRCRTWSCAGPAPAAAPCSSCPRPPPPPHPPPSVVFSNCDFRL